MEDIDSLKQSDGTIELKDIKKIIPYGAPFIFVDKILKLDKISITAVKEVGQNEDFLKGHFTDFPIMPGALMIEGLGQAATLLVRYNLSNHRDKDILAYKIKEAKFTAPVFPGSMLKYESSLIAMDEKGAVLSGKIYSNDSFVAEAFFMVAIVDKKEFRSKYGK